MNAPLLQEPIARDGTVAADAAGTPDASGAAALVAIEPEPGWRAAARRVAQIAAQFADSVDREARFPAEAFEAIKRERLLSAMIPASYGGAGLSLADVGAICEIMAQGCASTAMVYAMHQIQVACIEEHGNAIAWQRDMLTRIVNEQLLLASATSEETIGGAMRTSACAVEITGEQFRIEKLAPTISYGAYSDAILVTSRRTAESSAGDQVLIVALREQTLLEKRGGWDSMGMRGTCSEGFRLVATGLAEQILPTPFADIADQTMLPVSHAVGLGLDRRRYRRGESCQSLFPGPGARQARFGTAGRFAPRGSGRFAADDAGAPVRGAGCCAYRASEQARRMSGGCAAVGHAGLRFGHEHAENQHIVNRAAGGPGSPDDLRHGRLQERHRI